MVDATRLRPFAMPHALLAGGGSGGHVFPALALAEELTRRRWRVSFAGAPEGMEARLVPERGIPFLPLPARPFVGKGLAARVAAAWTLWRSRAVARRMIADEGIDVVVGTGGYVSAPAVLAARARRIPSLLLEPNARAGEANRFLSRRATAAVVAFESAARDLACPATVTGVPVRAAFFAVPELRAEGKPRLLVLGGSQGAQRLNSTVPAALASVFAELPGLSVLHQAGERHLEATQGAYTAAGVDLQRVRVVPFIEDVAAAMAAVDLVISRAGAITLAEIAAAGRPALLAALAAAGGHQRANAEAFVAAGAAEMAADEELEAAPLAARLVALLAARERLVAMGAAARALARPDAARAIVDRVEALARGEAA
jgi:UDP-N-acetylglucosamine--N-acetylmuramyl-(pentapeptide) pyrophosphoryl-undecaprenol N-acetylglucosamine transferase